MVDDIEQSVAVIYSDRPFCMRRGKDLLGEIYMVRIIIIINVRIGSELGKSKLLFLCQRMLYRKIGMGRRVAEGVVHGEV